MFQAVTVVNKPLGLPPGTLMKLTDRQAHDRRGRVEVLEDGVYRALFQMQFKIGEVVEIAVEEVVEATAAAATDAADNADVRTGADPAFATTPAVAKPRRRRGT